MKHSKRFAFSTVAAALLLAACQPANNGGANAASSAAASGAASAAIENAPKGLENEAKQISYIMAYQMGGEFALLKKSGVEVDFEAVNEALRDQMDGKPSRLTPEQMQKIIESVSKTINANLEKQANENLAAGEKFLAENKAKPGVKTTASDLQYRVNKEGTGDAAAMGDGVLVEYTGKLIDGTEFDKSGKGEPFAVPLNGNSVIPGWTEGLQLMKEGGEYTLYVPAKLAYGKTPHPKIPPNSTLVFEMKVVKIEKGAVKAETKSAPKK